MDGSAENSSVFTASGSASPLVIMPLGDSMTAGGGTADNGGPPPGAYRAPLYTLLTNAGFIVNYVGDQTINPGAGLPDNETHHEGIGGIDIQDMLSHLQSNNILQTYNPNLITLMIGYNDLTTDGLGPQATYNLLVPLVQYITSTLPNAKVVVSTIPPAGRAGSALEQKAERYDSLIRNGITGISPNVSVVDSRSAMTYSADIGPDHVHPNDAGDAVLAQTFFSGITAGTGVTVVPATTPAPTIYLTPTSGGSIIETSGVPLTMSQDGTILLGGVPLPGTLGSTEMAYYNNLIYSENFGNWYYYDGTVWHQTTTPPAGITPTGLPFTPTPGAPPPATPTAIPSATPTTPTTTPVTTMPTAISIGQNTDQLRFLASQNATDTAVTPPAAHPMATLTLADATGDSLTVPGGSGAPDRPTASLGSVCWHDVLQQFIISHS